MLDAVVKMTQEMKSQGVTGNELRAWVRQNFGSLVNVDEVMNKLD